MKTKPLLLAICLAVAGLFGSRAYAGGIVGYVNHVFIPGYNFANNPLNAANNNLSQIILPPPNGTAVYVWNVSNQSFDSPITCTSSGGWSGDVYLPVGRGFVLQSPSQWTNTFVGEVLLNTPPTRAHFVTYEGQPADWYLRLAAEGTKVLTGEQPNTPTIPISR